MNVINPLPIDESVPRSPRPKIVYVKELDAYIQENLLPDILRIAAEEDNQEEE